MVLICIFFSTVMSLLKLFNAKNMMTCLISIEILLSGIMIIMIFFNVLGDKSYVLLSCICIVVCEGVVGLSILSSLSKFYSNSYLYSLK